MGPFLVRRRLYKGTKWVLMCECRKGPWRLQNYSFPVTPIASEGFWDLLWEVCSSGMQVTAGRGRIKYEFAFRKVFLSLAPTALQVPLGFCFQSGDGKTNQKSNSYIHLLLPSQETAT